jgi:hypothetical protein
MSVPLELWHMIFDYSDFYSKITLRRVNSLFLYSLHITDLYNLEDKYLERLDDSILAQHPFVRYLFAFDNVSITNVNHLHYLEDLDASWDCGISDDGLKITSIKRLDVNGNPRVTNVNHMSELRILKARGERCGLSDMGIKDVHPETIDADYNMKITRD